MNNNMNILINDQLKAAMAALHHLDDAGCTALHVTLGQRKPVITIEAGKEPFVRGALKSRITIGGTHQVVMATTVHGCQVEWREHYAVTAQAVRS